jgi:hypothetical protein
MEEVAINYIVVDRNNGCSSSNCEFSDRIFRGRGDLDRNRKRTIIRSTGRKPLSDFERCRYCGRPFLPQVPGGFIVREHGYHTVQAFLD